MAPTGHIVAWQGWNTVGLVNYDSGSVRTLQLPRFGFSDLVFLPDAREVAFASSTNIMMWELARNEPRSFAPTDTSVYDLAFSPDASLLASGHAGGTLMLWDVKTGRKLFDPVHHPPDVFGIAFSPDGQLLASGSSDGTGKLWNVGPSGLTIRHTLRGHIGRVGLIFSPDGQRVLSSSDGDNFLKLWDPKTGLEVGTIYGFGEKHIGATFSRDGNAIYSADEDGTVRIWRAPPLDPLAGEKQLKERVTHRGSGNN
jgi:WD40 repeat protein